MKSILKMVGLIIFSISILNAQSPKVITLDDAVKIAMEHNLSVIQQTNNYSGQQSNVRAAFGNLLPSVAARGGWTRTDSKTKEIDYQGAILGIGSTSTTNYFSAGVSANWTLFDGFASEAGINRAVSGAASAEQALYRMKQSIVYQTHVNYLNVLRNLELMKVSEDNLKKDQQQLAQIVEMNKLGASAIADVYRQQYQTGNDELLLIQAKSNYEQSKQNLALFLGLPISDDYGFQDPAIKPEIDTAEFAPLNAQYQNQEELVKIALAKRPDYLSAVETANSASSAVTIAQGGHLPSVIASASYGLDAPELSKINDNRTLSWGLSISLPIFSGFAISNQVQQAEVQSLNAEAQKLQTERSVRVDVKNALLDLDAAQKQVEVAQKNVVSAVEDRKIQEEKYRLGASTLLDLLTAVAEYSNALSNKINSVYNYIAAKKNVELAIGTIPY